MNSGITVNVARPSSAKAGDNLPVVVARAAHMAGIVKTNIPLRLSHWIFGGGFELGSPTMYDGTTIVQRSLDIGQPVIYVSINYRVAAFGSLAGKEAKAAGVGNLCLQDRMCSSLPCNPDKQPFAERLALRWVQKYISAFGGDPTKVTVWVSQCFHI
jgi:acetylcholinesterase